MPENPVKSIGLHFFANVRNFFILVVCGTAIGGVLGILIGAASGAVAGNTVGKLIDENVMRIYRCTICNYQWRAA